MSNKVKKKYSLKFIKLILLVLFLSLTILFVSCKRKIIDGGHPLFIKAQNSYEDGNYKAAAELYKKYLKINPDSAKANFQLGAIYQEQQEYIQAIFYYEKYLDLKPDSSDRPVIERWIISSKKQLLEELENKYNKKNKSNGNRQKEKKLLKELDQLKKKNEKMKKFIIKHKDVLNNKENEATMQDDKKQVKSSRQIYIVEPGDTYYGISKKVYGTAKYFKYIWEHNKNSSAKQRLKPGDKLIIPALPVH